MKKTASLFLALALCLSLLSANAFAANNLLAGDAPLTFTASDGLVITAERLVSDNSIDFFYATEGLIAYTERSDPMLMGYMDHQGNIVIPPSLDLNYTYGFSDGLCRFAVDDPATGMKKFGFLDKQGNIVIPAIYDNASDFGEGLAFVEDSLLDDAPGYFIDHSGQRVMEMPTYEFQEYDGSMGQRPYIFSGNSFSEGCAIVSARGNDGIWHDYLMDKTGNVTPLNVPDGLRISGGVHSGLIRVVLDEGQDFHMGAIDQKGDLVIPCMYDELDEFYDGIARAKLNGQDYIINTSNDAILCFGPDWDVNILENGAGMARCLVYPGGTYLLTVGSAAAPELTATPTASTVLVNGANTAFDAYNIGGANYFKLRDLAYVLNGTDKQFSVDWDAAANAISLTAGAGYAAVGGEMAPGTGAAQTAAPTSSKILLNGAEVALEAYNIGGNNYFKLRDIGQLFDFGVDWDGAANTVVIDTSKGYTA